MSVFDRLKGFFNKILGRDTKNDFEAMLEEANIPATELNSAPEPEPYVPIEMPEEELVPITKDGVLDATSRASVEIFKHNLEVLIQRTKEARKVENFMIIREDDFFPKGWKWDVLSKNTNLEKTSTTLSYELRKAYALREAGLDETVDMFGTKVPMASTDQIYEAMGKVDRTIGNVLLPSRFRSTKHYTINTPLEVTGNYNAVDTERDYIVIDKMDNFLKSGYGYSAAYHDAYLDVSHEGLPISKDAVVLIKDENFDRIMSDPERAKELSQRRVIRYKGETHLAINMVLTEMGTLPSTVGSRYAYYDLETQNIIDNSIRNLASENNLFFDRSHAGSGTKGHFSNYYDDKNQDFAEASREYIKFLIDKFPEQEEILDRYARLGRGAGDIVDQIGIDELLGAIDEYNEMASQRVAQTLETHNQERQSITPKMHKQFTRNGFFN